MSTTFTEPTLFDESLHPTESCTIEGCTKPIYRKRDGLCSMHQQRVDKHGDPHKPGSFERAQAYAEITRRVQSPEALAAGECWEWPLGKRNSHGYGAWYIGKQCFVATRVVFELVFRPLAPDECVCHVCDNPPCYRPSHLFAGTRRVNTRDAARKRRFPPRVGERNPQAKVTDAQAREIAALVRSGRRTRDLAQEYGISQSQVQRIARGGVRGEPTYLGVRSVGVIQKSA